MKFLSLRMRLTLITMLLLFCSCILLTIIVNLQAKGMAEQILTDSQALFQSQPIKPETLTPTPDILPAEPLKPGSIQEPLRIFSTGSFLAMAVIILGGGILAYLLSGYALAPVQHIARQILSVDANNLSARVAVPKVKDELAVIAQAFNETADKLEKAFQAQKQFSANAAHELRTPLAVLQTQVDVFRKKKSPSQPEQEALIATVTRSIQRLSAIVSDLLALAQTGAIENREPVGLLSLAEDVAESLEPLWRAKQMRIRIKGSDLLVWGSYPLLYRALYNLIENGIKYGDAESDVSVAISAQEETAFIQVSNTGPLIPLKDRGRVFEPFFRADASRSRATGGVGLGLAIAQNILLRHDGKLTLAENPNATCFVIELKTGSPPCPAHHGSVLA